MNALYFLAEHRNTLLTVIFEIARFTSEEAVALILIGYLYLWKDKKLAYDIGFTFFFAGVLANTLKILFRIPRPWMIDPNFKPVDSAMGSATGYSFPSIHSQSSVAIYGTLGCSTTKKKWRIACVIIFLMVGLSRMYVGVHTPKDVIAGWMIGIVMVCIEQKFIHPLIQKNDPAIAICVALAVISVVSVTVASILIAKGALDPELAADVYKNAGAAFAFSIGYVMDVKVIHFDNTATPLKKAIRLVIAVVSLLIIKESFKILLRPIGNVGHFIRYVILVVWILIIYPMILMALNRKKGYNK